MKSLLNFVFINGRNGAGKDTQAALLVGSKPEAVQISTGDLFRAAIHPGGKYHEKVAPFIESVNNGQLLPDTVMLGIVAEEIKNYREDGKTDFIFTGFPRTVDQLHAVDDWLSKYKNEGNDIRADFIALVVSEKRVEIRAEGRRKTAFDAGRQPRADDEVSAVRRRLEVYKTQTAPMLHLLANEGRLHIFNSNMPEIEEVQVSLRRGLETPHNHRSRFERR